MQFLDAQPAELSRTFYLIFTPLIDDVIMDHC